MTDPEHVNFTYNLGDRVIYTDAHGYPCQAIIKAVTACNTRIYFSLYDDNNIFLVTCPSDEIRPA